MSNKHCHLNTILELKMLTKKDNIYVVSERIYFK